MFVRLSRYGLVTLAAALLVLLGVQARTHLDSLQENDTIKRLVVSNLRLDTKQANVSVTQATAEGEYFFQVSPPSETDLSIIYGWIRPESCANGTSDQCIQVAKISQTAGTGSRSHNVANDAPPKGDQLSTNMDAAISNNDAPAESARTTAQNDSGFGDAEITEPGRTSPSGDGQRSESTTEVSQRAAGALAFRVTPTEANQPPAEDRLFRVTAPNVNLRSGPGRDFEIVDVVTPSIKLSILEQSDNWSKVITNGGRRQIQGWIWSDLIAPENR